MVNRITKKNFTTSFHRWGSVASWLVEPLRGGCLLFPTKFPEIPGTYFIDLGKRKDWVDRGTTQWFSKRKVAWKVVKLKNPITFQVIETSAGFCLTFLKLNLIVHIKTMWFITISTKHPICKTSLRLNRCLIKVDKKNCRSALVNFATTVDSCSLYYISK